MSFSNQKPSHAISSLLVTAIFLNASLPAYAGTEPFDLLDAEVTVTNEAIQFSEQDLVSETSADSERLFPIGQMLVNRDQNSGLVLSCQDTNADGRCSRFRFAKFENASTLNRWTWASPSFRLTDRFKSLSQSDQHKKLRKWMRRISSPSLTDGQRMAIGFLSVFAGLLTWGLLLSGQDADGASVKLFERTFAASFITLAVGGANFLDVFSPVFVQGSRTIVGKKADAVSETSENYLIRKSYVRNKVFNRILSAIKNGQTYRQKWVTLEP